MEVDDREALFYVYSEKFLFKRNIKVTTKLTDKLMKICLQRSDYGAEDIGQLLPIEHWIQMIEDKLVKKFNHVKSARNDAKKMMISNTIFDAQRRANRRKRRTGYVIGVGYV
ncbi:unnamed protein product [Mucor hiemalis]